MRTQIISDRELVSKYLKGDEDALQTLVNRHREKIYSYIFYLVKDKQLSEDVFQDTFIKVIRTLKRGAYNEEGKFVPWVMRIAHNLVVDHFRKSKRMPEVSGGDDYDIFDTIKRKDPNVEQNLITEQIREDVRKLIDELPEEQKKVLIMRHYREMSFKEIAEETDVSINTALGRMRYALINLRKIIDEKNLKLNYY